MDIDLMDPIATPTSNQQETKTTRPHVDHSENKRD